MRAISLRLALVACAAIGVAPTPSPGFPVGPPQAAQKPAPTEQPLFRLATDLVVVDVSAISRDGTPVRDLQPGDFTVRIDGQTRRIAALKFVDQSIAQPPASPGRPLSRYSSNESGAGGRLIVVLVDEASIRFGGLRAAVESIDRLLDGFGPLDRIALATLPGPRMLVDFTSDRARVAAAIKMVPGGTWSRGPANVDIGVSEAFELDHNRIVFDEVIARECRGLTGTDLEFCKTMVEMEAKRIVADERNRVAEFSAGLRGILAALRAIDAPKLVILFSEGFASPEAPIEMVAFGREAAEARAVIYAMRLDRSMFDASVRRPPPVTVVFQERSTAIASLDALAGSARGTSFEVIGSAENPFKRLAVEVSGYYLIGVEPEGNDRNGKPHQIRVEVNRPGLTVRSRREFAFRSVVTDEKKIWAGAIASPLVATELPLRVATFNMADEDPTKVRVLVVAEIDRAQQQDGSAFVGFLLTDDKGKPALSVGQQMALSRADSGALSFVGTFPVPPGTYTMKLAAVRGGQVGSVEHRVSATLTQPDAAAGKSAASALQLGDVIVMPVPAARQTPAPPMDAHLRGDRVVGFVQVGFDPSAKEERTFLFDVVKEERGPALLSMPGILSAAAKSRARTVEARVDARLLPPGEYGVRVTVSRRGTPIATLFSPFSLERTPLAGRSASTAGATGTPPPDAVKFRPEDVLDSAVLAPFLEEVARFAPEASRAALEQARSGRFDEALRQLKPGRPGDPTAPFLRGLSLFAKGQLQPASGAFRTAIAAAPELLVGAFYIGACYAAGGDEKHAINAWQTSLIGLAGHPAVYRFLADALIRTGQSERASALLGDAAARWPDDDALRARAMRASLEAGRYERALEYADQAIERQPSDSGTLFLAMQAIFQTVLEGADVLVGALLPRLLRYQDLYGAAGGPQQALVAEWVAFVKARAPGGGS